MAIRPYERPQTLVVMATYPYNSMLMAGYGNFALSNNADPCPLQLQLRSGIGFGGDKSLYQQARIIRAMGAILK